MGRAPSRAGTDVARFAVTGAITGVYPRMTEDAGEKLGVFCMSRRRKSCPANATIRKSIGERQYGLDFAHRLAGFMMEMFPTKGDALRPVTRRMPLPVVRKSP